MYHSNCKCNNLVLFNLQNEETKPDHSYRGLLSFRQRMLVTRLSSRVLANTNPVHLVRCMSEVTHSSFSLLSLIYRIRFIWVGSFDYRNWRRYTFKGKNDSSSHSGIWPKGSLYCRWKWSLCSSYRYFYSLLFNHRGGKVVYVGKEWLLWMRSWTWGRCTICMLYSL